MSAFTGTPTSASPYSVQNDTYSKAAGLLAGGKVRRVYVNYTHAAAAGNGTGEVNLVTLPAGRIKVWSDSYVITSAFAATSDIHLGYRAYVDNTGATVSADDNAFLDNADAATGGKFGCTALLDTAANGGCLTFDTKTGLTIYAMIDTGNIETNDTIKGCIVYSID